MSDGGGRFVAIFKQEGQGRPHVGCNILANTQRRQGREAGTRLSKEHFMWRAATAKVLRQECVQEAVEFSCKGPAALEDVKHELGAKGYLRYNQPYQVSVTCNKVHPC